MFMKLSLEEVVRNYGSEKTILHYEKYKRIVAPNVYQSLLKTLDQHFESVIKVKEGRKVFYELSGERETVSTREDGRSKGGHRTVPYSDYIDILLLSVFPDSPFRHQIVGQSLSKILKTTNMQSEKQNKIVSRLYEIDKYGNDTGVNYHILHDIKNEFSLFKEHVKRSFRRLERSKLIKIKEHGAIALEASLIDLRGIEQEQEFHVSIDNETWNEASLKVKEGAEREEIKVFSVLYGSSNEKVKKIKSERDFFLKNALTEEQGDYSNHNRNTYWIDYDHSEIKYMYRNYTLTSDVSKDEIESLLKEKLNLSIRSIEETVYNLTGKLQEKRKDYIKERLITKYEKIREGLKPYEDEEWGEQESLMRKNINNYMSEYYDLIESGEADSLVVQIIDEFFSEKNLPFYTEDQTSKTENKRFTLTDSLTGFGKLDPSLLEQQQDHLLSSPLIQ